MSGCNKALRLLGSLHCFELDGVQLSYQLFEGIVLCAVPLTGFCADTPVGKRPIYYRCNLVAVRSLHQGGTKLLRLWTFASRLCLFSLAL